jgi:methylenetetrahydrofolate dehydrogenase (NADP+)/methenyltetrahydrofolate cyclohydrolase
VRKKGETCTKYGIEARDLFLDPSAGFAKLVETVTTLNKDKNVDGILVQSPLPKGWDERAIQKLVLPAKDVDGFHPENAGSLLLDAKATLEHGLPPCTPAGVIEVLKENKISIAGKQAVVVGRSTIVGKPMALMLLAMDATVTIAHSRTTDLEKVCSSADILVAAVGKKNFITNRHVKPGAVLLDVGINREDQNGKAKLIGDIDAASVNGIASFLTPVPNGIGPMTIALLLRNTVRAAKLQSSIS